MSPSRKTRRGEAWDDAVIAAERTGPDRRPPGGPARAPSTGILPTMRAIVCSPGAPDGIAFRDLPEPSPAANECVIAVEAVSLNRGEFRRLGWADEGWRPGYDLA